MAALSITATSVLPSGNTTINTGILGETATAGQAVYRKASDGKLWLAQADGTAAEAEAVGILLTGGVAGQPASYAAAGTINIGATTAKVTYFANSAAGGVALAGDISSTHYITRLGYGTATDGTFVVDIRATGVQF
jgi:hypothetical protein